MSLGWNTYIYESEEGLISNFLDLDARPSEGKSLPIRVMIEIRMQNADEDGLSSKEEDETLWDIEDNLEVYFSDKLSGQYVGRSTKKGLRNFCYFIPNGKVPDADEVEAFLSDFPEYAINCSSKIDKKWAYYFDFLYPSAERLKEMRDRAYQPA
ncbi:MAG: DUF695 domain-containing protein [bacterium]|nr:DUF695 domain-containing protein [bacterium]